MKDPAANRTITSILRALGIDPVQYGLLLDLFGKLSDRQEFELGSGQLSIRIGVGIAAALSAFGNLIVAFAIKPPLRSFILGNFVFITLLLVMILTMEAINTFLNPLEAVALAHQPIPNSYLAAKLTHLEMVVASVVFPVSIVPSLVGLNLEGSSWFYPITYLNPHSCWDRSSRSLLAARSECYFAFCLLSRAAADRTDYADCLNRRR